MGVPYKAEAGHRFVRQAYAYTPTDDPADWCVRLWEDPAKKFTEEQLAKAVAYLTPEGYRGNKATVPTDDMPSVRIKLREAWWQVHPDLDELPTPLRFKDYSAEQRKDLAKQGKAKPDGSYPIVDREDLQNAIRAWGRGGATPEDKAHIIKRARALGATDLLPDGWVGKQPKAASEPGQAPAAAASTGNDDPGDDGQPDDDNDADDMHGSSESGDQDTDQPDVDGDGDDREAHTRSTQTGVNYSLDFMRGLRDRLRPFVPEAVYNDAVRTVRSSVGGRARAAARQAAEDLDELEIIFSEDEPDFGDVTLMGAEAKVFTIGEPDKARLFNEISSFAEPPDWVPLLPKPGQYTHAKYGTIDLTRERNADFAAKVNAQVYQDRLPIDAEHQTKLSGAMAWITAARQTDDGSVQGKVEWTPRGRKLIEGDAFRYISPEMYDEWEDNATNERHTNVLIGAALTTRPFFKHRSLMPLVASEDGTVYAPVRTAKELRFTALRFTEHEGGTYMPNDIDPKVPKTVDPAQFAELSTKFSEMEKQFAELSKERDTFKTMAETSSAQAKDAITQLRTKRFTDMVMGQGGEGDGARWFGEAADNVKLLNDLADTVGEDSETFKAFTKQQKAFAAQMASDPRLSTIGSGQSNEASNTPEAKLAMMAKKFQETDPKLTYDQAVDKAMTSDEGSQLYTEFKRARKEAIV